MSQYVRQLRRQVGPRLLMLSSASAVVLNDADQVLLGRRSDNGQWSLPSGTVDPGEQPADTAVREVFEETGVHVAIERLAGVALHPLTYPDGNRCEYLNVWFRCRPTGGQARVNDDESTAVGWFPIDRLPEVSPWVRLRLRAALRDEPAAWFAQPGTRHPELDNPFFA